MITRSLFLFFVVFTATPIQAQAPKHLLQLGWDQPTTAFVRQHWQAMEAGAPFEGIIVGIHTRHGGRTIDEDAILDPIAWPREALQQASEDLRACAFIRFRHNFIRVNSTPGRLDWFDDAQWATVAEHLGSVAWLCRETAFKGICFDPESYDGKQYCWNPSGGRTFAEVSAKARQRGHEVMGAMVKEFPEITVFGLWLFSLNRDAAGDDSEAVLRADDYGLWPAFLNGWLDALPPGARLVDGMEHAYYLQTDLMFGEIQRELNGPTIQRLVSPENQAKYRKQVSVSFGIYLDAYLNPVGTEHALAAWPGGTRLQRLAKTLATARATADEYVWLYNEQVRWWEMPYSQSRTAELRTTPGRGRLAEEAFPGISEAIRGKTK